MHCGQRQDFRPLALHGLIREFLFEVLDSDARVWRTLRTLVREPGRLTIDWAAGRRTRQVPPFRLYLVLNVLVFLVFSLSMDSPFQDAGADPAADAAAPTVDLGGDGDVAPVLGYLGLDRARLQAALAEQLRDPRAFGQRIYERLPTVLLLLLPPLALVMRVLLHLFGAVCGVIVALLVTVLEPAGA